MFSSSAVAYGEPHGPKMHRIPLAPRLLSASDAETRVLRIPSRLIRQVSEQGPKTPATGSNIISVKRRSSPPSIEIRESSAREKTNRVCRHFAWKRAPQLSLGNYEGSQAFGLANG